MSIKVAINGFGRIGRNALRAHYEYGKAHDIKIVAINARGDMPTLAHMLRYDTVQGHFPVSVEPGDGCLIVGGDTIRVVNSRVPAELPWAEMGVDVVLECTGAFRTKETAAGHLLAGARKVIISAPAKGVDATVVYGVNDCVIKPEFTVISAASCTTNCLAPIVKALNDGIGVVDGLMTTVHSYTNDQVLLDVFHKDLRRARAAGLSMIPTKTGAAKAVGEVLPELKGKLDGFAVRVPTPNVSFVDLTFRAKRETTVEEVNAVVKAAAEGAMGHVLDYNQELLVSCDFVHNPKSSVFDSTLTKVMQGQLVKVTSWYDNEWGFSNRMLDLAVAMMKA